MQHPPEASSGSGEFVPDSVSRCAYLNGLLWAIGNGLASSTLVIYLGLGVELAGDGAGDWSRSRGTATLSAHCDWLGPRW